MRCAAAARRRRAARKTHELLSNPGYINHLRALLRTAGRSGGAACELSLWLNEPVDGDGRRARAPIEGRRYDVFESELC